MMADNTMATCGDVPERRGFLAIPRAERSDKACSRTFRNPPAAETFVNKSFRSTLEGSHAVQLTFGDCVQGGDCQLTVPSFRECLSGSGNEKAPPKDRLIPGPGCRLQPFEGLLERVVDEVGVDLGGREVPVPERTLHDQDVACPTVEVGGEGVAQSVGAQLLVDPRGPEPVIEPPGYLALGEARAAVREEQRPAVAGALAPALVQVGAQEGAQRGL